MTSQISEMQSEMNLKIDTLASEYELKLNAFTENANNRINEIMKSCEFNSATTDDLVERQNITKDHVKVIDRNLRTYAGQMDDLEQYSRINCLLIHGEPEVVGEKTDDLFLNFAKDKLGLTLDPSDISRSHRLGAPRKDKKPRPIIVKFCRYNIRSTVFFNKSKLKGSNRMVTESLTRIRVFFLKQAIGKHGAKNVWTMNGEIFFKRGKDKIRYIDTVLQNSMKNQRHSILGCHL